MIRRTVTTALLAAPFALSVALPALAAADAPPLFNVPVEVLPYIEVPPIIGDQAAPLGAGIRDLILGNPDVIRGGAGLLGGISCAIASISAEPC